jgi:hypothetical protein
MQLRTLFLYLIGNRQAILTIAGGKQSLFIALLFVLSAGFAREYDQEDLVRNPGVLVIPLIVSTVAGSLLFVCAWLCRSAGGNAATFTIPDHYRSFLTLFWMTAPLAWLYAVPYEEFLSPVDSTWANLITLGVVSLWRVLLMIRVMQVLLGFPLPAAFFLVTLFGNIVAYVGLSIMNITSILDELISVMGGIPSLSPSQQIVQDVTNWVTGTSCLTIPLWLVGLIISRQVGTIRSPEPLHPHEAGPSRSTFIWALAGLSLLICVGILPFTQAKQRRASRVQALYNSQQQGEVLDFLSRHSREDFPPYWEPPPEKPERDPIAVIQALEHIQSHETASWVREAYFQKATSLVRSSPHFFHPEFARGLFDVLEHIPGGDRVIQEAIEADSPYGQAFRDYRKKGTRAISE